ncbi:hypothetical protein B0H19DRAFT_1083934 [Mycena capillaripes]|nr:hypothetical protein B0H19DRAFT_1083934 [Mycena capillaripes]
MTPCAAPTDAPLTPFDAPNCRQATPPRGNFWHNLCNTGGFSGSYMVETTREYIRGASKGVTGVTFTLPDRAGLLHLLSIRLTDRYQRLGDLKDLQAALLTKKEAVELTPSGHRDRARHLKSLAVSLSHQYRRLGDLKDLEAAIQINQEAVILTPPGHLDQADRLQTLAVSLADRYTRLGDFKDLEASLQVNQEAVNLTPPGHPDRAYRLQGLATSFKDRYLMLKDEKDLQAVHDHFNDSFKVPSSTPENSWKQALSWAHFAEMFQPSDCIPALQAAFNLLPQILWIGNSIPAHHEVIHRLNISAATSTAMRTFINLLHLHTAVEILEQGLATISQQMLQLRTTDVDLLPPDQARKFSDLSSQLYSGKFDDPITVADNRNKLLKEIRKQPGFKYFLLPKSYYVLCHASQGGLVVILTSHEDRCDGIILLNLTADPVHIPLPAGLL